MTSDRVACHRCGTLVLDTPSGRDFHESACQRVPLAEDLVAMLDNDQDMTIAQLAKEYGTSAKFLYSRLEGTDWDMEAGRLRARMVVWKEEAAEMGTGPACPRCGLMVGQPGWLCHYCVNEVMGVTNWKKSMGLNHSAPERTTWNVEGR